MAVPAHLAGAAGSGFGQVLTFPDLQRIVAPSGPPPRASTVINWAEQNQVRFLQDGKGGICTTLDALNRALGIEHGNARGADSAGLLELI